MNNLPTSLYHVQKEHLFLLATLEEAEGKVTEAVEIALSVNAAEFEGVAISIANMARHIEQQTGAITAEIERLTAMKKAGESRTSFIKEQIGYAMNRMGFVKIDSPLLKLSFRASEAVEITDEGAIPQGLLKHTPESWAPNKVTIKAAIKNGETIPGAVLVRRQNLQIK